MKHEIISHLERIAKANGDSFGYKIDGSVNQRLTGAITTSWEFICFEDSDNHCFVSGRGETPEEAILSVTKKLIEDACEHWGYKFIE